MSLTIYSYVDIENINTKKSLYAEGDIQIMYVDILTSGKCFHTTYSEWNNAHSILFDCCDNNTETFYRDSDGFIPPHILSQIINSEKFKSKYREIQSDWDEQMEAELNYESQNDGEDYWDQPDYFLIKECERDLAILDFIISLEKEGIYYC